MDAEQMQAHLTLHGWVPVVGKRAKWHGLLHENMLLYLYEGHTPGVEPRVGQAYEEHICEWEIIPANTITVLLNYIEENKLWTS